MNKLGIKVYGSYSIFDNTNWSVNSIRYHYSYKLKYKFRLINQKTFGISLYIEKK